MQLVNVKLCDTLGGWRSVTGDRKRQAAAESGGTDLHAEEATVNGIQSMAECGSRVKHQEMKVRKGVVQLVNAKLYAAL